MRRRVLSWCLTAACLVAAGCNDEGVITVRKITFQGVQGVDEARLKAALATRENTKVPLLGMQLPWGRKHYFDRQRLEADLKRIQAFYDDRGYPDARVTGFKVEPNDKQDSVAVEITIAEGEPVIVEAVEFNGFDALPPEHLNDLKSRAPLVAGKPRDRQLVITTHEMAINELRDHGYPYAKVETAEAAGATSKITSVRFTAVPGEIAHFGGFEISGNRTVRDRVILREMTFNPGDLYRRSQLQESQRRLYGLELFQFVNVAPANPDQQPADVPMRISVVEGKHQRVNFGIGYGSEEKGRVDGEYRHVNFFGGARSAGIHARYSSLDRGVRVDFTQPYFFKSGVSFGTEARQWYSYTPAYTSVISGGTATVTQRLARQMSIAYSFTAEKSSSTISDAVRNDPSLIDDLIALGLDPSTGKQEGTLVALGLDYHYSTADNLLNATRGYQISAHVEEAGVGTPGTFDYYAVSLEGRQYFSLSDRIVLANRVQLGNIDAVASSALNVPFSKKFFLGGATSLRGWGRYEVSPIGTSGYPLGGNSLFEVSSELRATVTQNLGAVLFLDLGNVWENPWAMNWGDLRYDIGPGLRYQTPVGPIRFDVGYQLNPIPGLLVNGDPQTRRFRFHFSIGQAF